MEWQPQLSLRKGDFTTNIRMNAIQKQEALDNYFILLKEVLEENDLVDKPGQIYSVDESGMLLDHHPSRVLATKGQQKVRYRTSGNKSQVTVIGCIKATDAAMPPFVVWDAKSLNMEWTKGEVPGTIYGLSQRGWIDMEVFKGWFSKHFFKYAVSSRPLLLLLDGHSSHYNPEEVRHAKESDAILFTLIPHTTHEIQPLDTTVFGPLKACWREACHNNVQANPGRVISKYQFSPLLSEAWLKAMVSSNIISDFRICGICPFNPRAILEHDPCVELQSNEHSDPKENDHPEGSGGPFENDHNTPTLDNDHLQLEDSTESPFTDDEIEHRHEEGYDLHDPRCIQWLKENHPDSVPATQNSLISAPSITMLCFGDLVADFFSHVPACESIELQHNGGSADDLTGSEVSLATNNFSTLCSRKSDHSSSSSHHSKSTNGSQLSGSSHPSGSFDPTGDSCVSSLPLINSHAARDTRSECFVTSPPTKVSCRSPSTAESSSNSPTTRGTMSSPTSESPCTCKSSLDSSSSTQMIS